jgi:hypothetical protein
MYIIILLLKKKFNHDHFFIFKHHIAYEKAKKRGLTLNDGMFYEPI